MAKNTRKIYILNSLISFDFIFHCIVCLQWVYETLAKRDVFCCGCSNVKCWRHYLKDIKIESFDGYGVALDGDPLMNAWPNLPKGQVLFALEWCFDVKKA